MRRAAGGRARGGCRPGPASPAPVLLPEALRPRAALEAGAQAFLGKPLEPLRLVSTVRDLLGTSALARQGRRSTAPS